MKKHNKTVGFLLSTLLITGQAFAQEKTADAAAPMDEILSKIETSNRFVSKTSVNQLRSRGLDRVMVAPGTIVDVETYVKATQMPSLAHFAPAFSRGAMGLEKPPAYTEEIYQLDDRIIIDRTLDITYDPEICRSEPARSQSKLGTKSSIGKLSPKNSKPDLAELVCFQKKSGSIPKDMQADIDALRKRLAKEPGREAFDGVSAAEALKLSDEDLLDRMLNSGTRTFRLTSERPFAVADLPVEANFAEAVRSPDTSLMTSSPRISDIRSFNPSSFEKINTPSGFPKAATSVSKPPALIQPKTELRTLQPGQIQQGVLQRTDINEILTNQLPGDPDALRRFAERQARWETFPDTREDHIDNDPVSYIFGFSKYVQDGDTYRVNWCGFSWWHDAYYAWLKWSVNFGYGLRMSYDFDMDFDRTLVKTPYWDGDEPIYDAAYITGEARLTPVDPRPGNYGAYQRANMPSQYYFNGREATMFAGGSIEAYASIPGPNVHLGPKSKSAEVGADFTPPFGNSRVLVADPTLSARTTGLLLSSWAGEAGLDIAARFYLTNSRVRMAFEKLGDIDTNQSGGQNSTTMRTWTSAETASIGPVPIRARTSGHETPNGAIRSRSDYYRGDIDIVPTLIPYVLLDFGVYEWRKDWPLELDSLTVTISYDLEPHAGTRTSNVHNAYAD